MMLIRHSLQEALTEDRSNVRPPSSLLTIPGEIRNRIYDHLLLVGRINIFDCAACCTACDQHETMPDLAILRVNQQTKEEASAFLYRNSTFVVSTGRDLACFMSKTDDFCLYTAVTETFPSRAAIRSLEVRFVADYIPTDFHEERMKELWHSTEFREETRRRKAKHLHDLDRTASEAVWAVAGELICLMHGLQNLTVNIEQAFCPEGCCRLVHSVARSLRRLCRKDDLTVNVTGSLENGEVKAVMNALKHQEVRNENSAGSSIRGSEDRSDSESSDNTTDDSSDRNEDNGNDESINNSGHIDHSTNDTVGEQAREGGEQSGHSDMVKNTVDTPSGRVTNQREVP